MFDKNYEAVSNRTAAMMYGVFALIYAVLASGNNSKKVKENNENEKNI